MPLGNDDLWVGEDGGFIEPPADPMMDEMSAMLPAIPQVGPTPPAWYRKPPKPDPDDVKEDAEREHTDHAIRIKVAAEMVRRLNLETVGFFERDQEAIQSGEIETFQSTALRDEHDAACAWVSGMDLVFSSPYREAIDREEAIAKEDFLHFLWECWQEQHSVGGNGPLRWALPDTLQKYGMLAAFIGIDPSNDELGLRIRMIDPATIFPVHEGERGLACVYRIYQATAATVVGDFGDDAGSVERKVRKIAKNRGSEGKYDRHHLGEVIEYWDRHWGMVLFEGELVRRWEHGYTHVPFVVKYGCFGMQGFTQTPDEILPLLTSDNRPFDAENRPRADRRRDLARMAQPFLWRRTRAHDTEEAIGARLVTALRRSMNPPLVVKQGAVSAGEGDPEVDPNEGGMTRLREEDDISALPNLPAPEIMQPLGLLIEQNRQTGMAPGLLMGQNPASQTSGSALDILAAGGFEKWAPLVMTIEEFLTELGRRSLVLIKDWGELLGEDASGVLFVPRRNPNPRTGEAPAHELTSGILKSTGTRAFAKMRKFNPQSLGPVGNGLAIISSLGVIDKRSIIEILGFTSDPDSVLRRIDEDLLDDVPEVKQTATIDILYEQAEKAMARGDEESAQKMMAKAHYVASQIQMRQMSQMGMLGGGMPGMGMDPGMMGMPGMDPSMMGMPEPPETGPGGGMIDPQTGMEMPPPGVPQPEEPMIGPTGGESLPGFGIDTGTNGGRPPGGM